MAARWRSRRRGRCWRHQGRRTQTTTGTAAANLIGNEAKSSHGLATTTKPHVMAPHRASHPVPPRPHRTARARPGHTRGSTQRLTQNRQLRSTTASAIPAGRSATAAKPTAVSCGYRGLIVICPSMRAVPEGARGRGCVAEDDDDDDTVRLRKQQRRNAVHSHTAYRGKERQAGAYRPTRVPTSSPQHDLVPSCCVSLGPEQHRKVSRDHIP